MLERRSPIKTFLFYYFPLIFWMGIIFYLSSFHGAKREYSPDIYFYVTRKGAHIIEFLVLAFFFIRLLDIHGVKNYKKYLATTLFSLAYAFSDEVHQLFVPGREGKFLDIGFDLVGILLAILLYKIFLSKASRLHEYKT